MQIDLYTLYLFSYTKEYLFNKAPDLIKLESFSQASNCVFIDDFYRREVIARNPIDFFNYLKRRQCFNVSLSKNNEGQLVMKCNCRFSLEQWKLDYEHCGTNLLVFKKIGESLWAESYCDLSEEEVYQRRIELKEHKYEEI